MGVNNSGLNVFAGAPPEPEKGIGRVFWVGNSSTPVPGGVTGVDAAGAYGDSAQKPFATWNYAVNQCTASRNDIVYILPGHAETIADATSLDIDVAGVRTFGLGVGSNRPTFTVATAATATITFSAANTKTENIVVISGLDGLNTAITVTGADVYLDIEHRDTSATVEADIAITASGARFTCNLRDIGFTTGDQREASISMNGVVGARINIDQYGVPATAVVNFVTTLSSDVEVRGTTYVSGTTDGSKNVVDTIGSSLWYMDVIDAAAGARYTGGSAAAVASDDISAVNTVLGTVSTAAATGAVTSTDNVMAYLKQAITMLGPTQLDTDTLGSLLAGTAGIATMPSAAVPANNVNAFELLREIWAVLNGTAAGENGVQVFPAAAAAANNVSLAEVIRYVSELQLPRIATKTISNAAITLTTGASPVTAFTVTGDVYCRVYGTVQTNVTSTLNNGTLAVGVTGSTSLFLGATTADTTNFVADVVWIDTSPTLKGEVFVAANLVWALVASGADIIVTVATNSMTAGALTLYCEYLPVSSGASVVAA